MYCFKQIPINWYYDYVLKTITFKSDFNYFKTSHKHTKMKIVFENIKMAVPINPRLSPTFFK